MPGRKRKAKKAELKWGGGTATWSVVGHEEGHVYGNFIHVVGVASLPDSDAEYRWDGARRIWMRYIPPVNVDPRILPYEHGEMQKVGEQVAEIRAMQKTERLYAMYGRPAPPQNEGERFRLDAEEERNYDDLHRRAKNFHELVEKRAAKKKAEDEYLKFLRERRDIDERYRRK